jgi:hypothetical protein
MYYTQLNGHAVRSLARLGAPPTVAAPIVRHLLCTPKHSEVLQKIIGHSFTVDQVRDMITAAAGEAATFARQAATKLRSAPSPDLDKLFIECFGVGRKHVPSWRPAGQTWNVGGVVRTRFERAARTLTDGYIHYACYGAPWKEEQPDDPRKYALAARGGKYRIGFGELYWREWKYGSVSSPPAFLLGAALIIYFGPMITFKPKAPKTVSIFSYLRFAFTLAGVEIPPWVVKPAEWKAPTGTPTPPVTTPPTGSGSGTSTRPPRLRLTDEELERILGGKPKDPLDARIDWIISQVPPTKAARPALKDLVRQKFNEKLDQTMNRVKVPKRLQPYVRKAAHGAIERGSKLVLEESLQQMGVTDKETIEAITGTVERLGQESP